MKSLDERINELKARLELLHHAKYDGAKVDKDKPREHCNVLWQHDPHEWFNHYCDGSAMRGHQRIEEMEKLKAKLAKPMLSDDPTVEPDEVRVTDPNTGGAKGSKPAKFSHIPPDVLWELAEHYGYGYVKYPDPDGGLNWQRGFDWRLSVDALHRHLAAFEMGEDFDSETGHHHLIAVMWHAATLRWFQLHGKGTDYR